MLTTTLPLHTVKTNAGTTAVIATVTEGHTILLGESPSIGSRRAIIDVMSGSGAALERTLRRAEQQAGHRSDIA